MYQTLHHALRVHGHEWVISVLVICAAILVAIFAHDIFFRILPRFRHSKPGEHSRTMVVAHRLKRPALWIIIVTAVGMVSPALPIPAAFSGIEHKAMGVLWFILLGWLAVEGVYAVQDLLLLRYDVHDTDNLRARRVRTQTQVLRKLAIGFVVLIDVGLVLSVFHSSEIWHYGAGLLASAGLASLVLATAAKSTASNLFAGIQIAITEPFRIDDVVIVEGQWGRIEEITTSYVVVAIWDLRRLIVPLSYFIENPFQNWTRTSADLLGTSFLYVDYTVPVEALRQEFSRVLATEPLWDRKVCVLQVTNLDAQTMEIRCLLSARNSGDQFNLRCIIREKMIDFVRQNYPEAFPRTRFSPVSTMASPGDVPPLPPSIKQG